jgi:hypothetical protein
MRSRVDVHPVFKGCEFHTQTLKADTSTAIRFIKFKKAVAFFEKGSLGLTPLESAAISLQPFVCQQMPQLAEFIGVIRLGRKQDLLYQGGNGSRFRPSFFLSLSLGFIFGLMRA